MLSKSIGLSYRFFVFKNECSITKKLKITNTDITIFIQIKI